MLERSLHRRRILVLDDDVDILALIEDCLAPDYDVVTTLTARDALQACRRGHFHLALVDVRLPGGSGLDLVPRFRRIDPYMGVIMMTAYAQMPDAVKAAYDLGVVYIQKPFAVRDLQAGVRAALERLNPKRWVRLGDLIFDRRSGRAERDGRRLPLTGHECALLLYLISRQGQVVCYDELLEVGWGCDPAHAKANLVQLTVSRLRRKLGDDPRAPRYIETVRGVGYRAVRGGGFDDAS
jgi:DNA-binding response OmpR family regulator